jgi:hypothetical protein
MQQLLSDTKDKITIYKNKICEDTDYRKKIQTLEACITDHERHRKEALARFDNFKSQAEDRECRLKTDHSQTLVTLAQDVLASKKKFDEQIGRFEEWRKQVDTEKQNALDELRKSHDCEMDELRNFQRNRDGDWLNERANVDKKYTDEIEQLKIQCEHLHSQKTQMTDEYEQKLNKAQAFYEKELAALQHSRTSSEQALSSQLQDELVRLKRDFEMQGSDLRARVESLVDQLSVSEEAVEGYRHQLELLHSTLTDRDSSTDSLARQVCH